ncbi:PepSY domain-containing protein [Psychromonas sp. MB-3u-54]|uniref:PepSY domain-containing protein n=1 Tax=Psychromonas sp. MB-3u-54 TaxID=2058319 RepID=UPI000C33E5D2|nr:PepSY domain-containing protein [Psychromonas sp. MB-3u-54]PKH01989.1 PepSY domain-containing protein [Psychromonas sp. MB-3u-54]
MRKFLLATVMIAASTGAMAGPTCTEGDDKSNWIPKDQFEQNLLDQGYEIKKFKESSHGCYELYGYNQKQQRVEIYFHPETAEIFKQEIDD